MKWALNQENLTSRCKLISVNWLSKAKYLKEDMELYTKASGDKQLLLSKCLRFNQKMG